MNVPPKSGIKTSEFWITLAVLLLPLVNSYLGSQFTPDEATNFIVSAITVIGSCVAAVTYIIGRVKIKRGV